MRGTVTEQQMHFGAAIEQIKQALFQLADVEGLVGSVQLGGTFQTRASAIPKLLIRVAGTHKQGKACILAWRKDRDRLRLGQIRQKQQIRGLTEAVMVVGIATLIVVSKHDGAGTLGQSFQKRRTSRSTSCQHVHPLRYLTCKVAVAVILEPERRRRALEP